MASTRILGMCALWPWPWTFDLGSRSWHTLWSRTTIVWNIQIQHGSKKLWPGNGFWVCVHCDLNLGDLAFGQGHDLDQGHDTPLGYEHLFENFQDLTWQKGVMALERILDMCALRPWPWRYDLGSKSWHTLESWTIIVWNIIQIQHCSEELWPGHRFWVCVHCDLDSRRYALGQGHDTLLGHGQEFVKYYPDQSRE